MPMHPSSTERRVRAQRRFALPLLAASLLLHLAAFQWAEGNLGLPSLRESRQDAVTAVILPPPPPKPAPQPKPAKPPKPKAKRKRPPPPPPAPQPQPQPIEQAAAPAPAALPAESAGTTEDVGATAAPVPADPPEAEAAPDEAERYTISPPPSATLEYDVHALSKGQNWYGSGVYRWSATEAAYSVIAEASVRIIFKIDALNARSEGVINEFGLAPVLYSEKKRNKAMTNTHFRHAERLISFSASEATYPYQDGAQDRASIIWQLAAIGRGNGSQFAPGAELAIFVAERRDAATWQIQVVGEEEIDTPYATLTTWHVRRAPRPGSYEQQIDIWLAPQREWYPVKVRYTEPNGDYTDLSLSDILPATEN